MRTGQARPPRVPAGGLQELGWTAGHDVQIDDRWPKDNADRRKYADELVRLTPDIILARQARAWRRCSRQLPLYPSCLRRSRTRSAKALSRASRGRAATRLVLPVRIRHEFKMAGAAQRDGSGRDAGGGPSRSHLAVHERRVGCDPRRSAIVPRGGEPARCARGSRYRVRHCCLRTRGERRPDRAREHGNLSASRPHHWAFGQHRLPAVYTGRHYVISGGPSSSDPIGSTCIAAQPATWIASSRARSQLTYRCRCPRNMSW